MEPGEFQGSRRSHARRLDAVVAGPSLRARGRAERRRRAARRRRLRAVRLLRLRHRRRRRSTAWPPTGSATPTSTPPRCARRRGRACSPGRNHHRSGMGRIVEFAVGLPRLRRDDPEGERVPAPRSWCATATRRSRSASGTSRPAHEMATGGSRERWPLGRGFERFYGFLGGETDQYHPDLVHDNHQVDPPRTPEEGYHLTEDLADQAIGCTSPTCARRHRPSRSSSTSRPARATRRTRCRDRGSSGTRAVRPGLGRVARRRCSRGSSRRACCPEGTELSERPQWVAGLGLAHRRRAPPLRADDGGVRRLPRAHRRAGRAGARLHRGAGRARQHDRRGDERQRRRRPRAGRAARSTRCTSSTASPRASRRTCSASTTSAGPTRTTTTPGAGRGPGNTPLKRWKRETHEGGVADPLIVHWPARLGQPGETRHQYVHAIDVLPTLLDVIGIEPPESIAGVAAAALRRRELRAHVRRRVPQRAATSRSTTRCSAAGRSTTTGGRR